ncbi:hypothetical protein AAIB46_01840 [Streptomyces sp. 35M1]|uniref:hypothetical protein n=1 Tax=Streptomyces sp. 35M1 TaxID=3142978 RepID=UPI0039904897
MPDNRPDSPPGSSTEPARRDDSPVEARRVLLSRTVFSRYERDLTYTTAAG